jgi:hypothetical protein
MSINAEVLHPPMRIFLAIAIQASLIAFFGPVVYYFQLGHRNPMK